MSDSSPITWDYIAAQIREAILEIATEGMWIINVNNPMYEDLYIQGLWDDVDLIWLEIGNPDDQESIQIVKTKGWEAPDDELPNYYTEKHWSEQEADEVVTFLIDTFALIGLSPELVTLEIYVEDER